MFGIKFIKVQPTTYLLQYRGGKIVREGLGHSFFYYAPTTSLVAVPVASADVPFIFQETTADFQTVTIQGQMTYRVGEPKRLAALPMTLRASATTSGPVPSPGITAILCTLLPPVRVLKRECL